MTRVLSLITSFVVVCAVGCATAPHTADDRSQLVAKSGAALETMSQRDPGIHPLLARSVGYVVFPEIGKAGWGVGGAYGRGVLYEGGRPVGYVSLTQASFGLQAGAQGLSELIVFGDRFALEQLKAGKFELGGNLSAIAITAGAAANARFASGVAVFQLPRAGLMVEASVEGQRLKYQAG